MFGGKRIGTLVFVSQLMDHLDAIGARLELAKFEKWASKQKEGNILSYIGEDRTKKQLFLQIVYMGNRVGTNVNDHILDRKTVLLTWTPPWWKDLWEKLRPLVEKERERRKIPDLYSGFEEFVHGIKPSRGRKERETEDSV